jgi:hypothetical protein
MELRLTDPQVTVIKAALEFFRNAKQQSFGPPESNPLPFAGKVNEFDLLSPQHTLMHTITLLSKLTGNPVAYYVNPNPSQLPQPKTHENPHTHTNQPVPEQVMPHTGVIPATPPTPPPATATDATQPQP